MDERDYLLATLWGECRGEPFIGQVAVACVIRNRVDDSRWPNTYEGVVTQPKQFSCWDGGNVPGMGGDSMGVLSFIAHGVISGVIPDITDGANHYINAYARPPEPSWARKLEQVTIWPGRLIGAHTFYKL